MEVGDKESIYLKTNSMNCNLLGRFFIRQPRGITFIYFI